MHYSWIRGEYAPLCLQVIVCKTVLLREDMYGLKGTEKEKEILVGGSKIRTDSGGRAEFCRSFDYGREWRRN